MRILVTGANGQLGNEMQVLAKENPQHTYYFTDVQELDICDKQAVWAYIAEKRIELIVNCAAYTAVDKAEDNPELAYKLNCEAAKELASAAQFNGAAMIQVSTDYVFDGEGTRPWEPEDERHPLNVYGQTKYEGELAVQNTLEKYFIVRISWVFGVNGKNFIKTMLNLGKTHDHLTVVNDQFGSPTYTYDLARLLVDMILTDKYGIYHATNEGICNWYEFACEIFRQAGMKVDVAPVPASEYPTKAKRPENSRMSKAKLTENGFVRLPSWQDALERYLKEIL